MQLGKLRRTSALLTSAALLASLAVASVFAPATAKQVTCRGLVATIVGTNGPDVIYGTNHRDIIAGLAGNDIIIGRGGNDIVCGGKGADRLVGKAGRDRLYGNAGPDRLFGSNGPDRLFGGVGNDVLAGQVGNDHLSGGLGTDRCYQGAGTGPKISCELPVPTNGTLVIGGAGSGQVGGSFRSLDSGVTWSAIGDCSTGAYGSELRRLALEFPLSGLPAGATVTKATLDIYHFYTTEYSHSLRGYAGNGTLELADITPFYTTTVSFTPSPSGTRTTVDVTVLVTSSVVTSGWAGLQMRKDVNNVQGENWACRASDPDYPTLTIDYTVP